MTKSEIKNLGERVDRLNEKQELSLTTEEANTVRWFWIQLNYNPEEAEEYDILNKRQQVLYQNYLAGKYTPEEQAEWKKIGGRMVEIAHDTVMERVIANHALRDKVWPELTPRVLRFWKLKEKSSEQLSAEETKEYESLFEWFSELQREALGLGTGKQ